MPERNASNIPQDRLKREQQLRDAIKNLEGPVGLVLTRHAEDAIVIEPGIVVRVLSIEGDRVRLGINAPRKILILREEILMEDSPRVNPQPTSQ